MKKNKLILSISCITLLLSKIAFATPDALVNKAYNLTYNNHQETSTLLASNGQLYINIDTLKSLLGLNATIKGTNITFKDNKKSVSQIVDVHGDLYAGDLLNGVRHGYGTLYIKDGGKYEGEWSNGYYEGQGTLVFSNGNIYVGQFSKGFIHGEGKLFYPDGSYYTGHYEYGIQEGFGNYYIDKDNKYEGYWKNGLRNGKGKAYVNGYYRKGLWENNRMIKTLPESEFNF